MEMFSDIPNNMIVHKFTYTIWYNDKQTREINTSLYIWKQNKLNDFKGINQ